MSILETPKCEMFHKPDTATGVSFLPCVDSILLVTLAIALAVRGRHQDGFVPGPTAPMPLVNVP